MTRTVAPVLAMRVGAVIAATLAVTGCSTAPVATPASVAPTESVSAEATSTPTPEPIAPAALVIIGALGLTVADADGDALLEMAYSIDPSTAVDLLTETLGESPTALLEPSSSCSDETTITSWGGLLLDDPAGIASGPGALFTVRADSATTANGVPIIASVGFAVGDSIADVRALASARAVDNGGWTDIYADWQGAAFDDPEAWGVRGFTFGTAVERFGAPLYFYYDC